MTAGRMAGRNRTDISGWIAHRAGWAPDDTAIRFEGTDISYAVLEDRIGRTVGALAGELGIGEGDRVAHLGVNAPETIELLFACARFGAIFVPLNNRLTVEELLWQLQDCGARLLFVEPDFFDRAAELAAALPDLRLATYGGADPRWPGLERLRKAAKRCPPSLCADLRRPAKIVYTSGTTGRPKGAVLSQEALFYTALNGQSVFEFRRDDRILTAIPLFHVGGMNIQTLPALRAGAAVTLHRRFDPAAVLKTLVEDRTTLVAIVPTMARALFALPDFADADLSGLRCVCMGSSSVPPALFAPWHAKGLPVNQVYGLTESGPTAVALPIADGFARSASAGKPVLHCAAKVVADDSGGEAAPGEIGEIWLRGPNLMTEYWGDPEATADAFTEDDWFRTGDLGRVDRDGYFFVEDRKTDMIISGGENIYPAELERILAEADDLAEFAVVGRPDEKWGETPVCIAVPRPGSAVTEETVLALFDGRLARYKRPRAVVLTQGPLPRTPLGKVRRFELRQALLDGRLGA
ncbi:MAG: AMP-binding protein [Rhodospirillaceae bacterium]|nr:AMP-binding protein [Rhodospirillaceae bacterium]